MAIEHAEPADVIDVNPLADELANTKTHVLAKTEYAELIRMVLPAGKEIATHTAPSQIIVQCLEGAVNFTTMGRICRLEPGQLLYLLPEEPHSVSAIVASSLLLTMLPKNNRNTQSN